MRTKRILLAVVAIALIVPSTDAVVAQDSPLCFEFLDDFRKPCHCQRDPYEERIETERHDFTQSATTVGRGVVQIESGYSYFYKDTPEETESSHTTPELQLRWGLSEDIEARLRWNHAWVFIEDEPDKSGFEDLRYALKLQLTRERCSSLLPTSAIEIRGSAPTGGDEFTTRKAEFSLDLIYQWTLAEGYTLAGSTGYGSNGFGDFGLLPDSPTDENFNAYSQSVAFGIELGERNTMYSEWYGIWSDGLEEEFSTSIFNVGIDHYLSDDLVIDFRVGVGLTEDSDDLFTGVGGGFRF